ncbi:NACHT domain protein [Talaromyces pinophilus]|uniref:NACHT domain protein n=1 Tax=Talaromyces pinophilus TaxID=128442 RepID=A0A0B8N5G4_TALPI|nr:NACHT domain protein [Talaromyces pinophilus]
MPIHTSSTSGLSASEKMARLPSDPPNDKLSILWRSACDDYTKETGIAIVDGDFPRILNSEDLSRQLDAENGHFQDFRTKRSSLFHAMQIILSPFETWGDVITDVVSAGFPPASCIMGAMMLLIRGARKVSKSFDMLTDLFRKLGNFALRLESYKNVPLSEGMKTIIVKVLINVFRVCAASQKLLNRGSIRARVTKWAKNVFVEDTSISSLLSELEELTSQEHKMVSAHGLDLTHLTLRNTAKLLEREDERNDRDRLDKLKKALNPISASGQVFSSINESRMPGSGSWVEDRIRSWWQGSESLLWIHGGPGVGKSYLASKIINDLAKAETSAGSAPIVASFFIKNNDVDLRSLNKALRTLAWQVAVRQSSFAAHAEEFCLKEDPANSYVVWRKLLLEYFSESSLDAEPCCFVIDGIDEADPEEQEILFSLLESTHSAEDETAPFRVVFLGRDSIRGILEEHALDWIPEIEINNNQNKDDLHRYVSQKLQKTKLFRGAEGFQDEVIRDICAQAEGLWEWANLVIKSVTHCRTKEQIRKVIRKIPRGISAMLQAELERLGKELSALDVTLNELPDEFSDEEGATEKATATRTQQLSILLSLVTKARKPLSVDHLGFILKVLLDEEVLNLEDDLHKIYSSLFSLRPARDDDIDEGADKNAVYVTLRHSSFYDFFSKSVTAGPIHVDLDKAEALFVYVLLYTISKRGTSSSGFGLFQFKQYAQKFLPEHLSKADPEKATNREEIARLLEELLTEELTFDRNRERDHWLIETFFIFHNTRYILYPSSSPTEIARYWWETGGRDTANERAELVFKWLTPDAKQLLWDCARSSAVASDYCSFTILFSRLAESFSRHWLAPKDIEAEDGTPGTVCNMLLVYHQMAGTNLSTSEEKISGLYTLLEPRKILEIAEMQFLEKTPIWHAKLAQTLLHHHAYSAALEQFQISLDENNKHSILSKQAIAVIHRDMARSCSEVGRYKEALEHSNLAESLQVEEFESFGREIGKIGKLLNIAQVEYHAKMTDKAIATVDEAWEAFMGEDFRDYYSFTSFFSSFLELHQTHRIRPTFDLAFSHFHETGSAESEIDAFVAVLRDTLPNPRLMERILHHVLIHDDRKYIDLLVPTVNRLDSMSWKSVSGPAEAKYFLGSLMFEHGVVSPGIRAWYEISSIETGPYEFYSKEAQKRSRSRLADVCLYHPEIPLGEGASLVLDESDESGDICLFVSSWLRDHGDIPNSRKALRGRVKSFIEDHAEDWDFINNSPLIGLFKTFLIAMDSEEDLNGALYLLKTRHEQMRKGGIEYLISQAASVSQHHSASSEQRGDSEYPSQVQFANEEIQETVDDVSEEEIILILDPISGCAHCKREFGPIYHWYFCRTCPLMMLCRRCYGEIQSDLSNPDKADHVRGICDPRHEFFYSGPLLRPDEYVPEGMVVLQSADGEKQTIAIKEWKDRLAKKWETADFAFEGGLSSWCMQILPEPQRSRWATFFKT